MRHTAPAYPGLPAMFARRTGAPTAGMTSPAARSTRHTVLIAGAANLFVAAIKLAAGILAGSSAMLAEAAHSIADTLNQAFLLTSVQPRGAAG